MTSKQRQIERHLADVVQGRKTVGDLVAQKALYEGKSIILTEAITIHKENPIGQALLQTYESVCGALAVLQQEGQQA